MNKRSEAKMAGKKLAQRQLGESPRGLDGVMICKQDAARALSGIRQKAEHAQEAYDAKDWNGLSQLASSLAQDVAHLAAHAGSLCTIIFRAGDRQLELAEECPLLSG
jgi:hypothetical protein